MARIPRNDTAAGWYIAIAAVLVCVGFVLANWNTRWVFFFGAVSFSLGLGIGRRSMYRSIDGYWTSYDQPRPLDDPLAFYCGQAATATTIPVSNDGVPDE